MTWTNQEEEGRRQRKNYDDAPQVAPMCTMNFPKVSFGGYGYMFLFFAPSMATVMDSI